MDYKQQRSSSSVSTTFNGKRRTGRSRNAATQGGKAVSSTLLQRVPLFPIFKYLTGQLYYEPVLAISASLGSVGVYFFSANGVYDPNITGTGHQPMGFDQMMLVYEQYTVLKSHLRVNFISSSSGNEARVALFLSPDTTVPNLTTIMENGLLKSDVTLWGTDGANRLRNLEITCDVAKYFGHTREAVIADANMYGTAASNPTEQVYFGIAVWSPFQAAATSISFDVTMSFDVHYWEPRKLASS